MKIPIAKIGDEQERDVLNSSGDVLYDEIGRICTVVKPNKSFDDRGDKSPLRISDRFGGYWKDYNNHHIVQVAGCPLKCPYCYVDNLRADREMGAGEIVGDFYSHWRMAQRVGLPKVNVLHLMGGAPAKYPSFWGELRREMDREGDFGEKVLFSDVIFVENHFYGVKPWEHTGLHHFILTGCLKGTNRRNFLENTGRDLFGVAVRELERYAKFDNFYLSLINYDEKDLPRVLSIVPRERIDFLKVVNYNVTQKRMAGELEVATK